MANTIIQLKRSSATETPPGGLLNIAEPAYSFSSGKLFLGNVAGTGVIEVGGQYWTNTTVAAYTQANTARDVANSAVSSGDANAAANIAVAAFTQANTARTHANSAFGSANLAWEQANTARDRGNVAFTLATDSGNQANIARNHANSSFITANLGWAQANASYDFANTRYSSSGGTISGDVTITGNLTFIGELVFANASTMAISDPLIFLASNNRTSDTIDIGIVGNYVNATGSNVSTGIFRDSTQKEWYLFYGYDQPISGPNHIDPASNNFVLAVLNADIRTSNLNLAGANAVTTLRGAYDTANVGASRANIAWAHANAAFGNANTVGITLEGAHARLNTSWVTANSAFTTANLGWTQANTARDHANAAFEVANTAAANAVNASALNTGTVPSARISGSYTGITGVGNITVGTWSADAVQVAYGGTGMTSFTQNGVLFGNTAGSLKVTAAPTEGQVLQGSAAGVPVFGMIDGGNF